MHWGVWGLRASRVALLALCSGGAGSAFAQGAEGAASTVGVEEVLVTAQRKTESLSRVPLTVSAFSSDDVARLSITENTNLQFTTPGLTFPNDNGAALPYIRGVGTGFSGAGLEGSVALYQDGVYVQAQVGATAQLLDIAQIQVLKGPQGTLYGRNATGGAIVITTHDPTDKFEGHLKGGIGNLKSHMVEGVLNVPITKKLAFRFAGIWEDRGGHLTNIIDGKKQGGGERHQFRGKLLWTPTENFSVTLKSEYARNDFDFLRQLEFTGTGAPSGLGFYETMQSPRNERSTGGEVFSTVWLHSAKLAYQLDNWQLTDVVGYRKVGRPGCADQDFTYAPLFNFCNATEGNAERPEGANGLEYSTLTNEFNITSSLEGPLNVTGGVFYERDHTRYPGQITGLVFAPFSPTFDNRNELKAWSVFGEVYYTFLERWKVTLGARYNEDDKTHTVHNNLGAQIVLFAPPTVDHREKFSNFTPRAVLAYDAGFGNFYFSYGKGFKSGGFNSPTSQLENPLRPEEIRSFEVGAKLRFFENRAHLDIAAFTSKWRDLQVAFIDTSTGGLFQQNAAGAKSKGVEANLSLAATNRLTIQMGAAYLHSRYSEFPRAATYSLVGGVLAAGAENLEGFPTTNSPDFTMNGNATYAFDLPAEWSGSVTVAGRYTTKYDFTPGAGGRLRADRQQAFGILNFTGRFLTPNKAIELSWYVNNVTETHYNDTIQTTGGFGAYRVAGLPRTFGGAVQLNF